MNIASYIILGIVIVLCILAVYKMVRDKQAGKNSCCGDCSSCKGCNSKDREKM